MHKVQERGASGQAVENAEEGQVFTRRKTSAYKECGSTSRSKDGKAIEFLKDAEKEKAGRDTRSMATRVSCQEYLEQVKCCAVADCAPRMMNYCFFALKGGDWEDYESIF